MVRFIPEKIYRLFPYNGPAGILASIVHHLTDFYQNARLIRFYRGAMAID
jgi:hypothetical protein